MSAYETVIKPLDEIADRLRELGFTEFHIQALHGSSDAIGTVVSEGWKGYHLMPKEKA